MSESFLHPDCPDRARLLAAGDPAGLVHPEVPRPRTREALLRYGPTPAEAALRVHAEAVTSALATQQDQWRHGFTRRRVIAGAGAVGVAALGAQLVTTRVAFADPATVERTLVVIFLRGGMDGLSVIVPRNDPFLLQARPGIGIPSGALLSAAAETRFGLNPAMQPLHALWTSGMMAAVHAVASPDLSRSHFEAQDTVERGAASTAVRSGWLDRVLAAMGPGTTFRAIAAGAALPRSLVGGQTEVVLRNIQDFTLDNAGAVRDRSLEALKGLYTGLNHPLAVQAQATLSAINASQKIAQMPDNPAANYPGGGFAAGMRNLAKLIKAKVGMRVAAIDVGGWDMHTGLGNVDNGDMKNNLAQLSQTLAAFAADVGPDALRKVNVVTLTEFGRRVEQNGNAGTDHGHGGVVLLLGGGLNGGRVHGRWPGLAPGARDKGDLAGANDYRDVLAEMLRYRFGVAHSAAIFPGHQVRRIGAFVGS